MVFGKPHRIEPELFSEHRLIEDAAESCGAISTFRGTQRRQVKDSIAHGRQCDRIRPVVQGHRKKAKGSSVINFQNSCSTALFETCRVQALRLGEFAIRFPPGP